MKFLFALATFGANSLYTLGSPSIPLPPPNVPPNLISEYFNLFTLCQDAGVDSYVGVLYKNSFETTYNFNQCYPYMLPDGTLAEMAVFCKPATCENNPNPDCTGGAIPPVPVPVVPGLTLVNAVDFVQLIGQGATCQKNGL